MKKIRKDIILLSVIVLIAFMLRMMHVLLDTAPPAVIRVVQDGKELGIYSLSEEQEVEIPYGGGNYNIMLISGGRVSVSDADCPDGLCIRQKAIARNGESIICLPHKLVIQIESKEESGLDAVTY